MSCPSQEGFFFLFCWIMCVAVSEMFTAICFWNREIKGWESAASKRLQKKLHVLTVACVLTYKDFKNIMWCFLAWLILKREIHTVSLVPAQHYLHGSIDSRVCSQAEVSPRNVVAYGGRDYTHGDAELFIATAGFKQLQHTFIRLLKWHQEWKPIWCNTGSIQVHFWFFERWCLRLYLKPSNYKQSWDLEFGKGFHNVVH